MLLTSWPTYPTSVNLVASTRKNGAFVNLASRRAIYVFPDPVGPEIRIFFGVTYFFIISGKFFLLQRFLIAIATAFFALCWPITKLSKY